MKTISRVFLLMTMAILAACASRQTQPSNVVYYDMGPSAEVLPSPLRGLDVVPSSWLASSVMHYRLAYADGSRREHYASARWTAQPAELLNIRLQQSLIASAEKAPLMCRVRIELDDLVQVFDSANSSYLLLEARATLYGAQQLVLARKPLRLQTPAGADAPSAVAASAQLTTQLARELNQWIKQNCK
jgi:cholesterol transport system auxiliary component